MNLALHSDRRDPPPAEIFAELGELLDDWTDAERLADAVAQALHGRLRAAAVSVFRLEPSAESVVLLGAAPARPEDPPLGTRFVLRRDTLGAAIRERAPQRKLDVFVEPDFVRSQPGETRSEIVVPVLLGEDVVGAIQMAYTSPAKPPPLAELLAEQLARPLALALRSTSQAVPSRPDTDSLRARKADKVLASVADQLAHGASLEQAMDRIASAALELVCAEGAVLLIRHRDRQMLEVAATAGSSPLARGVLIPVDGTVPGAVLSAGRPQVASPSEARSAFGAQGVDPAGDALCAPLSSGGKPYGVLAVIGRSDGGDFSPADVGVLQRLADQSAAIETRRVVGPLRQRLSDASLIAEVGRSVTGTLGVDEVLALIVQAAQMLVNGDCAAVGLLTPNRQALVLEAASGSLLASQGMELPVAGSLMGWAVTNEEALVTDSVSDDPRSQQHDGRQGPGIVVPLESRGRVLGSLLVACPEAAPPPTDEDMEALRKLAAYAAIAIENARLYQKQQELTGALRKQAGELERAYAELRTSQNRLVVSEKMAAMGRVTAGIAHEINSPLGGIMNCLQLARGYADEYGASVGDPEVTPDDHLAIAADLKQTLEMAESAAKRVGQFVRTIKSQTRMSDEKSCEFDPAEEIRGIAALIQYELRKRGVALTLDLEDECRLTGDPGKFAVVVQNLLSNALDASDDQSGEILVRFRHDEAHVTLEVEDHGSGIAEDIRPRIFDYLFTTKDVGQGTGLGLAMVHSIVTSNFGGDIEVKSEIGVGTTMSINFPRTQSTE